MPITMTQVVPGMTTEIYEETIQQVGDALRGAPGFISHSAVVEDDATAVTEVWESREQWQEWFDSSIKPNLPPDLPEATVTELHNAFGR